MKHQSAVQHVRVHAVLLRMGGGRGGGEERQKSNRVSCLLNALKKEKRGRGDARTGALVCRGESVSGGCGVYQGRQEREEAAVSFPSQ